LDFLFFSNFNSYFKTLQLLYTGLKYDINEIGH